MPIQEGDFKSSHPDRISGIFVFLFCFRSFLLIKFHSPPKQTGFFSSTVCFCFFVFMCPLSKDPCFKIELLQTRSSLSLPRLNFECLKKIHFRFGESEFLMFLEVHPNITRPNLRGLFPDFLKRLLQKKNGAQPTRPSNTWTHTPPDSDEIYHPDTTRPGIFGG